MHHLTDLSNARCPPSPASSQDDNGCSEIKVKIRVMPTCFLVLLRHFLYVDRVVARSQETRFFHVFGSEHIIRSVVFKEAVGARDENGDACGGGWFWFIALECLLFLALACLLAMSLSALFLSLLLLFLLLPLLLLLLLLSHSLTLSPFYSTFSPSRPRSSSPVQPVPKTRRRRPREARDHASCGQGRKRRVFEATRD